MNNRLRRIGIILIVVLVVPALLFISFELTSLNSNEKVIEKIYESQLDAILFSVNQYSQDIMESWAGKIEEDITSGNAEANIKKITDENNSIDGVLIGDAANYKILNAYGKASGDNYRINFMDSLIKNNKSIVGRLVGYQQSGFRKLEPVKADSSEAILFFTFNNDKLHDKFCILLVNSEIFIEKVLAPKIKSVSGNEFLIYILSVSKNYSFDNDPVIPVDKIRTRKAMWLLPGFNLGILLQGETIDSMVKQRAITNLALIVILIIVLLFGIYIVFKNVRREIEISQMKSDFVSNVSHELRTPLSMISMFAETLEMGRVRTEEKKQEYYGIISQETARLSRIVNSILNFSRIEAGKRNYNFVDTFLNDIVENVFSSYKVHLAQNGFEAILDKDDSIPVQKLDEEAVSEAFMNLLDNAVKYSKENKKLLVRTGFGNGLSFVEVKDYGIGIPKEDQNKIYEKFFRVGSGLVHNVKGTGLGLSIVKHIVEAHKGIVELESEPGKGSLFRLKFPLRKNKN
ncbi:MAG TPA: HAMP domain-containing sensor histidine kinase [Ignavibacteriaceae bacterium]|nr:HAMP domain-containing sensor histidine kinase [Ignavibacteriaceae bacterium]